MSKPDGKPEVAEAQTPRPMRQWRSPGDVSALAMWDWMEVLDQNPSGAQELLCAAAGGFMKEPCDHPVARRLAVLIAEAAGAGRDHAVFATLMDWACRVHEVIFADGTADVTYKAVLQGAIHAAEQWPTDPNYTYVYFKGLSHWIDDADHGEPPVAAVAILHQLVIWLRDNTESPRIADVDAYVQALEMLAVIAAVSESEEDLDEEMEEARNAAHFRLFPQIEVQE